MTESSLARGSGAGADWRALRALDRVLDHPWLVDASLALALTLLAQVELASGTPWGVRAAVLVGTGVVAARSVAPMTMAAVASAAIASMGLASDPPSVFGLYLAVMLISFSVAAALPWARAVAAGLLLAGGIVLHDIGSPRFGSPAGVVGALAPPVLLWGLGRIVYTQRARAETAHVAFRRLEEERDAAARAAVEAERARLSR